MSIRLPVHALNWKKAESEGCAKGIEVRVLSWKKFEIE